MVEGFTTDKDKKINDLIVAKADNYNIDNLSGIHLLTIYKIINEKYNDLLKYNHKEYLDKCEVIVAQSYKPEIDGLDRSKLHIINGIKLLQELILSEIKSLDYFTQYLPPNNNLKTIKDLTDLNNKKTILITKLFNLNLS